MLQKASAIQYTTHLEKQASEFRPPAKKRSIFKSKNSGESSKASKGLSLYKHKWNSHREEEEAEREQEEFKKEVLTRAVFGSQGSRYEITAD